MFESFLGMLRKRRRVDGETETTASQQPQAQSQPQSVGSPHPNRTMLSDDECTLPMQINDSDSDLLVLSRRQLATIDSKLCSPPHKLDPEELPGSSKARSNRPPTYDEEEPHHQHRTPYNNQRALLLYNKNPLWDNSEAMEIDSAPVPPPQEYSDSPFQQQHSESSMNFDYLSSLHTTNPNTGAYGSGGMDTSTAAATSSSYRKGSDPSGSGYAYVDDRAVDRFVGVLDQLDARVEKFRKDALGLQEKKDFLLMSIDLIKTNDLLHGMSESEREEISCYIQRVNSRLSTVELNVRTVRDNSQEDSLSQINMLIDMMITLGDPVLSRQRCQQYLNACSSSDGSNMDLFSEEGIDQDVIVDKKFECALLGCTLDDQKNIKKRLQALMGYLNKQTIRD